MIPALRRVPAPVVLAPALPIGAAPVSAGGSPFAVEAGDGWSAVADAAAEATHVHDVPEPAPAGRRDGSAVAEHGGFPMVPNGRLRFADGASGGLVAVRPVGPKER